jgi:gas vesicle protein
VNNRDRNFAKAKMKRRLQQIDESIARYLSQMASADRQDTQTSKQQSKRLQDKITKLKKEVKRLTVLEGHAQQAGPANITDRPRCALDGDQWPRHWDGRL